MFGICTSVNLQDLQDLVRIWHMVQSKYLSEFAGFGQATYFCLPPAN